MACSTKDNKKIFRADAFELYRCSECKSVMLSSDKREEYEEDYYRDREKYYENYRKDYSEDEYPIPVYKNIIENIQKNGFKKDSKLLEVGCSKGIFLHLADKKGFNVTGLDTSQYAIDFIKKNFKFKALHSEVSDAGFQDDQFDIIVMIDVIEHLEDPGEMLFDLYRVLKPGGIIIIDTPNETSLINRISFFSYFASLKLFKFLVRSNHDIEHLSYFSPLGIRILLEKYSFKILRYKYFNIDPSIMGLNRYIIFCAKIISFFAGLLNMQNKMVVFAKK